MCWRWWVGASIASAGTGHCLVGQVHLLQANEDIALPRLQRRWASEVRHQELWDEAQLITVIVIIIIFIFIFVFVFALSCISSFFASYKNILIQNLFLGFKDLLIKAEELNHSVSKKSKKSSQFFTNSNPYDTPLSKEAIDKAKTLWNDEAIKATIADMGKFEFTESLQYVMAHLDRIAADDWRPSNEDVLHVRQRTTGIVETRFKVRLPPPCLD